MIPRWAKAVWAVNVVLVLGLLANNAYGYQVTLIQASIQADINGDGQPDTIKFMEARDVTEIVNPTNPDETLAMEEVIGTWAQIYDGGCKCEAKLFDENTSEVDNVQLVEIGGETYLGWEAQGEGAVTQNYWRRLDDYDSDSWVESDAPGEDGSLPFPEHSVTWQHTGSLSPVTIEVMTDGAPTVVEWTTTLAEGYAACSGEFNPYVAWRACGSEGRAWIDPGIDGWRQVRWCQDGICNWVHDAWGEGWVEFSVPAP